MAKYTVTTLVTPPDTRDLLEEVQDATITDIFLCQPCFSHQGANHTLNFPICPFPLPHSREPGLSLKPLPSSLVPINTCKLYFPVV